MSENLLPEEDLPQAQLAAEYDVIVIGAGVAGLYCAWKLREKRKSVAVCEALDFAGGRIQTRKMGAFNAEYGPMRFEKEGQPLLMNLLKKLKIETVPFTPFQGANAPWPKYDMGALEPYSTLDVLRLGLARMLQESHKPSQGNLSNPKDPKHQSWLNSLTEADYEKLRREARRKGDLLHTKGFWNALADELPHQAILKIRDVGTFYHLIPENPNAIEWAIFWLRGLKDDQLVGIQVGQGSSEITVRMLAELAKLGVKPFLEHQLLELAAAPQNKLRLRFRVKGVNVDAIARHAILAMPRSALLKIPSFNPETRHVLETSVFGFPLLKCFFVVDKPWWKLNTPPHTHAWRTPTREIHYYNHQNGTGMVMLYTDRPATEYWKGYVTRNLHDRPEIDGSPALKARFFKYLATELLAGDSGVELNDTGEALLRDLDASAAEQDLESRSGQLAEKLAATVTTFGIRDWSREPFGGACHAWSPGAQSWKVLEHLRAFSLPGSSQKNVHVCGEAYSDYHGFIEGSLRSSESVLAAIP